MPNPKSGTITFDLERAIARGQGRPRRVQGRQGRHHPRPVRQGQLRARAARRQPGRAGRRRQPRPPQRRQGPVLQEPDGRLHHGPRHPRGCPGHPRQGSGLTAGRQRPAHGAARRSADRSRDRSATDSVASEAPSSAAGSPMRPDRTEIVDRTRTRGRRRARRGRVGRHGPPSRGAAPQPAGSLRGTRSRGRRLAGARHGKEAPCRPRPSRPRSPSWSRSSRRQHRASSPTTAA